jgi:hypothetical protein
VLLGCKAPLALLSLLSGVVAWFTDGGVGWLVAAVVIGAVVPFTLIGIMPTNHKLLAPGRDLGVPPETRTLLKRWARLHAVRTALSVLANAALHMVATWILTVGVADGC